MVQLIVTTVVTSNGECIPSLPRQKPTAGKGTTIILVQVDIETERTGFLLCCTPFTGDPSIRLTIGQSSDTKMPALQPDSHQAVACSFVCWYVFFAANYQGKSFQ